jgi:hypothetical protein
MGMKNGYKFVFLDFGGYVLIPMGLEWERPRTTLGMKKAREKRAFWA